MKFFLSFVLSFGAVCGLWAGNSTIQKPAHIKSSVMRFRIVDLMTAIPREQVENAVEAVKEQIEEDFSPLWGIGADIKLLKRGKIPTEKQIRHSHSAIIFLFNKLTPAGLTILNGQHFGVWSTLSPPNDTITGDGPQPNLFIGKKIPHVPFGIPIGLIPFGENSAYGVSLELADIPSFTPADGLSTILSQAVMNILSSPFQGALFAGYAMITTPTSTEMDSFATIAGFPVSKGIFNTYTKENGLHVSNFVLPQYFNPDAESETPFDFLRNVKKPFTPFGGTQFLFVSSSDGSLTSFADVSSASDPEVVTRVNEGVIFPACRTAKK